MAPLTDRQRLPRAIVHVYVSAYDAALRASATRNTLCPPPPVPPLAPFPDDHRESELAGDNRA